MSFFRSTHIFLLIAGVNLTVLSQVSYSLQDILCLANENGSRLKIIESTAQSQYQQVEVYRSEAFPKIDLSAGIGYASQTLQSELPSPGDISSIFDRIDGFMFNWALSFEQPLFKFGQVINSFRLASLSEKLTDKTRNLQRNIFFLEVIEQFIQTYVGQLDYVIAQQAKDRSQRRLQRISAEFQSGRVSIIEQLRTEAIMEGDRASLISSTSNKEISRRKLNVLIGIPDNAQYVLVLDTESSFYSYSADSQGKNPEIAIKELEKDINTNLRKNAWSSFFPSLSITGSIFNEFMAVDTSGLTEKLLQISSSEAEDLPISDIPVSVDFFNPDFINYSIGLQLTWNIFNGKRSLAQYRQAKSQESISGLELKQLELENDNNIKELRDRIKATDNAISAYLLQLNASERALNQAEMDFQDGFIDVVSYIDIEQEYRDAMRSFDNAKLQRILLQARLRIALGLGIYED